MKISISFMEKLVEDMVACLQIDSASGEFKGGLESKAWVIKLAQDIEKYRNADITFNKITIGGAVEYILFFGNTEIMTLPNVLFLPSNAVARVIKSNDHETTLSTHLSLAIIKLVEESARKEAVKILDDLITDQEWERKKISSEFLITRDKKQVMHNRYTTEFISLSYHLGGHYRAPFERRFDEKLLSQIEAGLITGFKRDMLEIDIL